MGIGGRRRRENVRSSAEPISIKTPSDTGVGYDLQHVATRVAHVKPGRFFPRTWVRNNFDARFTEPLFRRFQIGNSEADVT
jgi:hypothetical protein